MLGSALGSHWAIASMWSLVMLAAVFVAQQVLGEHLQAVGKLFRAWHRVQPVDLVTVTADLEGVLSSE